MKHLCIINPMAGQVSGNVNDPVNLVMDFFARNPRMNYAIHITRWKRDAIGYTMRYVKNASEMIRVYAFGGGGTLFEVINGVMGLPNVQVAYFPLGTDDDLILAFGKKFRDAFKSMRNLSLSPVITIDTILAGNHYVASNITIGIGAVSYQKGVQLSKRFMLPQNISYNLVAFYYAFIKAEIQHYRIEMENIELEDDYVGIFIANISGNGGGTPAPEARFDDGYIDMYVIKQTPTRMILRVLIDYQTGLYKKWPDYIRHFRCKKLRITSPRVITMILDGEVFYNTELNFEIHPASLNLVCPFSVENPVIGPLAEETSAEKNYQISDFLPNGDFP